VRLLERLVIASAVSAALLATLPVHAGESDGNAAAAESLFQEGRKLMDAKRYGDACSKFAASQKMAPAIGTLLNLADCYEKNNQLASAWARFHEAIALAQRLGRGNREQTARERAEKIEPRLIKLSILARASGIDVKLDGNPIDPSVIGTPIPVDAGKHTVEASAKGKKTFTKDIDVSEKVKAPSVEIPPLEDEGKGPIAGAAKDPKETKDPAQVTEPPKEERRGGWSTQKTLGVVAAGAGVLALGAGAYFGLKTNATWKEAMNHCNASLECDDEGVALGSQAKSSGTIATIAIIAGGVFVAGGAVLFFTAKPPPSSAAVGGSARKRAGVSWATPGRPAANTDALRIGLGPGSIVVGGSFQ